MEKRLAGIWRLFDFEGWKNALHVLAIFPILKGGKTLCRQQTFFKF
jgi:hypothetical protein